MKQCIDEGILQSFYDGELGENEAQKVTTHLLHCATCSAVAGELNRVTDLVSAALAPEFQAPVPTERLRTSINAAIADLQVQNIQKEGSFFASLKNLFVFDRPQAFGFASLVALVVFAAVFGIVYLRQAPTINPVSDNRVAVLNPPNQSNPENSLKPPVDNAVNVVKPDTPKTIKRVHDSMTTRNSSPVVAKVKLLPGEKSYLKTIAALDNTIKAGNDKPMRPALRAEYERNLALVDQALAAARSAAKKTPNDPDAAEFVFAAYQSKVDLMNTVADARIYNRQP